MSYRHAFGGAGGPGGSPSGGLPTDAPLVRFDAFTGAAAAAAAGRLQPIGVLPLDQLRLTALPQFQGRLAFARPPSEVELVRQLAIRDKTIQEQGRMLTAKEQTIADQRAELAVARRDVGGLKELVQAQRAIVATSADTTRRALQQTQEKRTGVTMALASVQRGAAAAKGHLAEALGSLKLFDAPELLEVVRLACMPQLDEGVPLP